MSDMLALAYGEEKTISHFLTLFMFELGIEYFLWHCYFGKRFRKMLPGANAKTGGNLIFYDVSTLIT